MQPTQPISQTASQSLSPCLTQRYAHTHIDLHALAHNLSQVKTLAPKSKVLAMVKANGYGHGATQILAGVAHADALGVACLEEALPLIEAGWQKPIVLIEGVFSAEEWASSQALNIECVIHNHVQLQWFLDCPHTIVNNKPIWLKLNTGMNRLGFNEPEIVDIARQIHTKGNPIILTSHFANADIIDHPMNHAQGQLFSQVLTQLKCQISPSVQGALCNSAGIVNFPQWHFDWVRPGIMLYGATPVIHQTASTLNLRPVMAFFAKIFALHDLSVGETVGYGSRWVARQPSRIGIVSIGYGDGYPRVVSESAYVTTHTGDKLPIIGRVAMDMLMVDLTQAPDTALNTTVQLWGDSPTIDEVAMWNNTISYEILCKITQRPQWVYNDNGL